MIKGAEEDEEGVAFGNQKQFGDIPIIELIQSQLNWKGEGGDEDSIL